MAAKRSGVNASRLASRNDDALSLLQLLAGLCWRHVRSWAPFGPNRVIGRSLLMEAERTLPMRAQTSENDPGRVKTQKSKRSEE
jgi:hypothetical protein